LTVFGADARFNPLNSPANEIFDKPSSPLWINILALELQVLNGGLRSVPPCSNLAQSVVAFFAFTARSLITGVLTAKYPKKKASTPNSSLVSLSLGAVKTRLIIGAASDSILVRNWSEAFLSILLNSLAFSFRNRLLNRRVLRRELQAYGRADIQTRVLADSESRSFSDKNAICNGRLPL
jgi:hypothetical protein